MSFTTANVLNSLRLNDATLSLYPETHPKRASVAAILRVVDPTNRLANRLYDSVETLIADLHDDCVIELLYIKRTAHPKDPYSGDVALPGGKVDPGETDFDAAVRETFEEVGLKLDSPYFAVLTRLNDREVTWRGKQRGGFALCAFAFLQLQVIGRHSMDRGFVSTRAAAVQDAQDSAAVEVQEPLLEQHSYIPLKLHPNEVAGALWIPLQHFLCHNAVDPRGVNKPATEMSFLKQIPSFFLHWLGLHKVYFPSVVLPHTGEMMPDQALAYRYRTKRFDTPNASSTQNSTDEIPNINDVNNSSSGDASNEDISYYYRHHTLSRQNNEDSNIKPDEEIIENGMNHRDSYRKPLGSSLSSTQHIDIDMNVGDHPKLHFNLWGLTLGITNDLLLAGGVSLYRGRPLNWPPLRTPRRAIIPGSAIAATYGAIEIWNYPRYGLYKRHVAWTFLYSTAILVSSGLLIGSAYRKFMRPSSNHLK